MIFSQLLDLTSQLTRRVVVDSFVAVILFCFLWSDNVTQSVLCQLHSTVLKLPLFLELRSINTSIKHFAVASYLWSSNSQ